MEMHYNQMNNYYSKKTKIILLFIFCCFLKINADSLIQNAVAQQQAMQANQNNNQMSDKSPCKYFF